MMRSKRIFIVADTKGFTDKLLLSDLSKLSKGLIRLGHDIQVFSYNTAFWNVAPVKSKLLGRRRCAHHVNDLLVKQIGCYDPEIIFVKFCNFLNGETIARIRQTAPSAKIVGFDCDLWPELHKGRIEAAKKLDFVFTTFAGIGLEPYDQAGVKTVFMPNMCDPDIECRYEVLDKWKSDILFTGKERPPSGKYPTEAIRSELIRKTAEFPNSFISGSFGNPWIGGMDYYYAMNGTKVALSVNARNDISLYHSDRLTQYLSCGTFMLAKKVPDSEFLFKDGEHLKYFNTVEEFEELARYYLDHKEERNTIADAGMQHVHNEFNCQKIAGYIIDTIETGSYSSPWNV